MNVSAQVQSESRLDVGSLGRFSAPNDNLQTMGRVSMDGCILSLNHIPAAAALIDRNFGIVAANDLFSRLELFDDPINTRKVTDALGDPVELRRQLEKAFQGESVRLELLIPDKTQVSRTFEIFLGQGVSNGVHPDYVFVLMIDISDVVGRRDQVLRSRIALAQVERTNLVREIASGLAHELAQPLTAIEGYASGGVQRMQSGQASDTDLIAPLQKISDQVDRAGTLLRTICDMSQTRSRRMQYFDIDGLIEETTNILRHELYSHETVIDHDLNGSLPKIKGDRAQVQQVLLNLIQNSLDVVDDKRPDGAKKITVSSVGIENGIEISVADDGPGFDEELRPKAFDPFITCNSDKTGMGLTICETIIGYHDGKIWIEPSITNGAIVRFRLPIENHDLFC